MENKMKKMERKMENNKKKYGDEDRSTTGNKAFPLPLREE
jgi:hypothetical protein